MNIRLPAADLQVMQLGALEDNVPSSRLNATYHAMATLEQLLQSVSAVMFPDQLGQASVSLASHGYDGDTALHVFAWRDDTASARVLLEAGADPNARGEMEDTPLHVAITRGNAELAALLLSHGADPGLRSAFGSARELAAESGGAMAALFDDDR